MATAGLGRTRATDFSEESPDFAAGKAAQDAAPNCPLPHDPLTERTPALLPLRQGSAALPTAGGASLPGHPLFLPPLPQPPPRGDPAASSPPAAGSYLGLGCQDAAEHCQQPRCQPCPRRWAPGGTAAAHAAAAAAPPAAADRGGPPSPHRAAAAAAAATGRRRTDEPRLGGSSSVSSRRGHSCLRRELSGEGAALTSTCPRTATAAAAAATAPARAQRPLTQPPTPQPPLPARPPKRSLLRWPRGIPGTVVLARARNLRRGRGRGRGRGGAGPGRAPNRRGPRAPPKQAASEALPGACARWGGPPRAAAAPTCQSVRGGTSGVMAPNGAVPRGPPPVTCGYPGDGRASPPLRGCVGQRRRSPPPPLGGRGRRREVEMSGVYRRPRVQPLAGCLTEAKSTCGDFSSSCCFLLPRSAGKCPRGELSVKKWLFSFRLDCPFLSAQPLL